MEDECIEELGRPISQMKVTELRDELSRRALSKSGNKKELIDRLRADIHRQPSQKSDAINLEQQQQQAGQQQTTPQHQSEVPQNFVGQTDASNQQQIAHQLNPMYPQQTQMPTSIPPQYHNLPQQMQQKLIEEIQNNYQASINNLQQQAAQQQLASNAPQNLQTSSQPPMDMRIPQSAADSGAEQITAQSLDLSSNSSLQNKQVDEADEKQATVEGRLDEQTEIQARDETPAHELEPTDGTPHEESNAEKTIELQTEPQADAGKREERDEEEEESQSFSTVQETIEAGSDKNLIADVKEIESNPISLKRGISDSKSATSSREKRRKWSSKQDSGQVGGDSQVTAKSEGISSHRLQELIEESPPDSKNVKQASPPGEDSRAQDVEEGQIMDTSGESSKVTETKGTDPSDSKTATKIEVEARDEREPEREQEQEREPSNMLLVRNLVRPFTINSLKEVLSQHGQFLEDKFWINKVKSKCCVVYENVEVAKQTRESLNGQQWPLSNPKTLNVTFSSEEELTKFQKSDIAKPVEPTPAPDNTENGESVEQGVSKSMVDRLGEKVNERERASEHIKKRLGEKITTDIEAKTSSVNRERDGSRSQELDDLFRKTKSVPHLFWLPLTEEQADVRAKERTEREDRAREVAKSRRSPPRYRSQARRSPRTRSPPVRRSPVRRRSPPRHRSPIRQRSPVGRSPPPRHRSPLRRRSPVSIHRSPGPMRRSPIRSPAPIGRSPGLLGRSPGLLRRSPGPIRRSPGPIRRSPGPIRRSPGLIRRSPINSRRSPGPIRRSPGPNRRSPMLMRRSPRPIRRSPGLIRRSPGQSRRSPGLIRRSPHMMRNTSPPRRSPMRKRSPVRRRSPVRYISPDRSPVGYGSSNRFK